MKFTIKDSIPFPRQEVFSAQRDQLAELAPYLGDIESITVTERTEEGTVTRLVNIWKANGGDIPKVARSFIKPEMLQWTDYAAWNQDAWECSWNIELGFLPEAVKCTGATRFADKGSRTTVTIEGEITVDGEKIPGVPRFAAKKVGDAVEKFVVNTIKPNLMKTNEGVTAFLKAQNR